ncbi:hypothetical protein PR048_000267 [Dryococelus australis]|uniref:Uncharacterized protein n=1 Tax=Dryococelus australis TaxID=614101 RepID=A0ABQ9IE76_9NEOP|nr:hypothetical protein PR048_000267 [Dryococelus australis]
MTCQRSNIFDPKKLPVSRHPKEDNHLTQAEWKDELEEFVLKKLISTAEHRCKYANKSKKTSFELWTLVLGSGSSEAVETLRPADAFPCTRPPGRSRVVRPCLPHTFYLSSPSSVGGGYAPGGEEYFSTKRPPDYRPPPLGSAAILRTGGVT